MEDKTIKIKKIFDSLEEGLKKDLEILEIDNKNKFESSKVEVSNLIEERLKNFYYWLFGTALFLLIIIIVSFFYLRNLSTPK